MNKATVVSPNAIPLLLLNILDKAVSVIGIVILNKKIAIIPQIILSKAKINKIAEITKDRVEVSFQPSLSPIIPPIILPKTTAETVIIPIIKLDFQEKFRINPI